MGKPTGFMEYERKTSVEISPKERIKNFNEFHIPLSKEEHTGGEMYGLRCAFLSGRYDDLWNDFRMSP